METLRYLQQTLPPFAFELIKLSLGLTLLGAIFLPLEKLFSLHPQKTFRKGFVTDLAYYFISSLAPRLLIVPMSVIALGLHYFYPIALHQWMASLPLTVRFGTALIVAEIGFYWGHRCVHHVPCLWRFHAVHHSAEQMDWLVNTRAHPVDMLFIRLCGYVPLYLLGLAQPMGNQVDMVPILVTLIGSMWGYFIHANVRWRFSFFEHLVATPAFHHWHHTNDGAQFVNKNYAALFPWMDILFGSFYLPRVERPTKYGANEKLPQNLILQLVKPFTENFSKKECLQVLPPDQDMPK
jgi:sterol desaturase/sphingolipid hydroxylase (fatty acid hydroxylase superfamily)